VNQIFDHFASAILTREQSDFRRFTEAISPERNCLSLSTMRAGLADRRSAVT
jgi:hypothetical protein